MAISTTATASIRGDRGDTSLGHLVLRSQPSEPNTSVFPHLEQHGYCVVRNVLSPEVASAHVDKAFAWLEGFGKGFRREDRTTWSRDNLPAFTWGGMWNRYGVQHEQWVWDIRSEPALVDVFAKIWGTEELLVSFDAVNISLPLGEAGKIDTTPWPHVDQSPLRQYKHCIQGIMNLFEVGPKDGSLMVLDGSYQLFNEFFEAHEHEAPSEGWNPADWFKHSENHMQWFYSRGCQWKKVEAGPGDVILWDSRTVHYGAAAEGDNPRVATYVCYKPAADIQPTAAEKRKESWENLYGTSHDPLLFRQRGSAFEGTLSNDERVHPIARPILSDRAKQLAGIVPY